jgi:error-prone DNA polymerase
MTETYVELHAASAFSFLEAASLPEAMVERAAELEMPAMALLDRNGFYGSARFHILGQKNNIRAHVGAEISVSDFAPRLTPPGWLPHQHPHEPSRLPLLCASRAGYQNLCQLITRFKMREPLKCEGAATLNELEEFAGGLICLTGGDEGPLAASLALGGVEAGVKTVERLVSVFGHANVYVELQRHQQREQEWRNQAAIDIAKSLGLPIVATNGVRYATAYEREVLDIFTTIRHRSDLDHAGRLLSANVERHLRSAHEMHSVFHDHPRAIANTREISGRLEFQLDDLGYEFPRYPVPAGESMDSFLQKRVEQGVAMRYGLRKNYDLLRKVNKQVEHELALIARLGFAGYFLIVWDLVEFCKRNDILVQGRGSAANSVVCYALAITAVDPVGMELLFERFLSESRGEWPDIDLDLPSGDKREQAIQYIYQRYGELGAAMTANVITYRGKSAAREVGKALGFDQQTLGRLSSLVGHWEWRGPNDTMAHSFHHAGFDLQHPRIAKYLELCLRLQDLPRHLGQHSGGMVICQGQLNHVVPIERASMPGRTVVQWDKEDCSDLGLIKVDLLGLGMMAVIKDCLELIPRQYGKVEDLAQLPQDDPLVYKTLQRADTVGMFQVESRAQMASLPRNMPRAFYDIVVQVAIIRPGPIVGGNMNPYMRRRQGKEKVTYLHPSLEPVLRRTLGVPLFQEQLLRIAMTVAGFTGAEAEELRRAVGMKRSMARMKQLEVKLRKGMTERGLDAPIQDRIVQGISSFALYGFPESHAASFALIAYASAYFKVHYLAAFTCAMLNNQPMGFYMPAVLVKDAQRHGLRISVIDVLQSEWPCTLEKDSDGNLFLRMGLLYVKGLREQAAQALVESRKQHGPFLSADELALRVPAVNPRELKQLARVGALNNLGGIEHRRDALWQVEQAGRPAGPLLRQHDVSLRDAEPSPLAQMTTEERLVADYSGTGLTVGKHPMAYRREELHSRRILSAHDLQLHADGTYVRTAGCVIARQRPGTAKGFIFLSMEDETGILNVIIGPELYERERVLISREKFLLVEGKLQNQDTVVHVRADRVQRMPISQAAARSHDFH